MKKTKLTKFILLVSILMVLLVLTTTVLADTDSGYSLEGFCEGFTSLVSTDINCGEYRGANIPFVAPEDSSGGVSGNFTKAVLLEQ